MKRLITLITLIALLSSFAYAEVAPTENNEASEIFYAENYQIREVPQFYVDQYDIEIPYMALGYVSGDVQDGMPQGGGNLRIFDYNKDGSLKRTIKLIGEFENGVLVGPGQMFINYEVKPAEPQVAEIMGDFYYGLLHGKSTVIMRGFNSESNQRLITVYEGTYEFGDKEGQFTERTTIDDQSTTMTGVFENDVKVGEWTPVGENASASN